MVQYTQFKQVIEIDNKITNLHMELSNLYAKRALFMGTSELGTRGSQKVLRSGQKRNNTLNDPWLTQTYSYLANAWMVYGIVIPDISDLSSKLNNARGIINKLEASDIKLSGQLGVLLVPPADVLTLTSTDSLRHKQSHILLKDYINPELPQNKVSAKKTWQVLVCHLGAEGLDYGSASEIIKHRKYSVSGYDTRALGLRQYLALTLQVNQAIDQNVWTILLGDRFKNIKLVPSATFLSGQYRFELDESNSILGEERFRPAVEVKG